jgi:ATP-binding cassette subfamily B protein
MRWARLGLVMTTGRTKLVGAVRAPGLLVALAPYRRQCVAAFTCALGRSILGVIPILVIRDLIDTLQRHHVQVSRVGELVGIGAAALIAAGLLGAAETSLTLRVATGVVADLRSRVFGRLLEQSVAYHTRARSGELMSQVLNDIGGIDEMFGTVLLNLATSSCVLAASLVVMFFLSWQLALLALLLFPLVALALRLGARPIYLRRMAVQEQFARLTAYLGEMLGPSGIMLIKSLGRDQDERQRFAEANTRMRRLEIESGMAGQWITIVMSVLQMVGPIVLLLVGSVLLAHHQISLGTLVAFAAVATTGLGSGMQTLAVSAATAIRILPLWNRVQNLLDNVPDIVERPLALDLAHPQGRVTFDRISFSYPGQRSPALSDVSIDVAPGQLVALVGPSGAGKTTMANLVVRFYDPDSGQVRIDGHDLRDLKLSAISDAVGMVLQETYLLNASVRENLLYARPDATDQQFHDAALHAALDEVIVALPDGYDTVVGERGYRLSGGERQRMAIARIILKDPSILVLDEATSHLDSLAESRVQAAMTELFRGRTSLVIAHRLSTVRSADVILVLDRGRIVERGTHGELYQAGGLYSRLHSLQFLGAG